MNQMQNSLTLRFGILTVIVVIAAFTRLLPHIPNVTMIAAMALFGGAYFADKRLAILVPLIAMFISDVALYFIADYAVFTYMRLVLYGSFMLISMMGMQLRGGVTGLKVFSASIAASVLFFIVTNFGVWALDGGKFFPLNGAGLIECYAVAIPFFRNTLVGDLVFVTVLFGGFELAKAKFPVLSRVNA